MYILSIQTIAKYSRLALHLGIVIFLFKSLSADAQTIPLISAPPAVTAPSPNIPISTLIPQMHTEPVIVPFDSYSNLVLVQVQVNNAGPLTFAIDTAFTSSLIDQDSAKALKLPITHAATPLSNQAQFATFTAKINDLQISDQQAKIVNLSPLAGLLGIKINGIFGADLFQRYGITINYETRAITFTSASSMTQPPGSDILPITESPKGLLVPVLLTPQKGDQLVTYAKIDTGSVDALQLTEQYVQSSPILVPQQQEILVQGASSESQPGEEVYVTRLAAIQLARYEFKSPIANHNNDITPHPYSAVIGGEILRRFTVAFDLGHSRIYLTPNSSIHQPFIYDGSGLTLEASGPTLHTYTVTAVRPFSPGADAEVKVGDILTSLGDQPCDSLTLADVRTMFAQVGKVCHPTFEEDGKTKKVTLVIKWRV